MVTSNNDTCHKIDPTQKKFKTDKATIDPRQPPLTKLPPTDQVQTPPSTKYCSWTFDSQSRILLASFQKLEGKVTVTNEDEAFLLKMMERDDITVISENLGRYNVLFCNSLCDHLWL